MPNAIVVRLDVRGYVLWPPLDSFEWAWGYSQRFDIVQVDLGPQARTVKASGRWPRDVITANGPGWG